MIPGSKPDANEDLSNEIENLVTNVERLRLDLAELGCSTKGNKETLQKRLKQVRKSIKLAKLEREKQQEQNKLEDVRTEEVPPSSRSQESLPEQPFDYYLFFDVEATCEENIQRYPHEIIEFPVILVDGRTFDIVDQYRSYVKPYINPVLSEFCVELTGISQETVDKSPDFIEVLNDLQIWMAKYTLFQEKSAIFVTDGPFDIRDFITKQCNHDNISVPLYFHQWVDIRKTFARFHKCRQHNIAGMLAQLNLDFEGRAHSGLDDAKNIYRIAKHMRDKGCKVKRTNRYTANS